MPLSWLGRARRGNGRWEVFCTGSFDRSIFLSPLRNSSIIVDARTLCHSVALSVKMHILLSLPAVLYIVFINLGTIPTLLHIALIILVQICLAAPFAATYPSQYISGAFNFSRSFDWKWTVNWRWLGEEAFKSQELSRGLLALHVLGLLILLNKWASKEGGILQLARRGLTDPLRAAAIGGRKSSNDCESSFSAPIFYLSASADQNVCNE